MEKDMNPHYTKPAFSRNPDKQKWLDRQYGGLRRTCTVCGETKPAAEFATLRYVQDGLNRRRECRCCANKKMTAASNRKAKLKAALAEQQRLAELAMPPHLNPTNRLIVCPWQP